MSSAEDRALPQHRPLTIVKGEGRTQLTLRYEPMGPDLVLRISGANEHVGAVALSEYDTESNRAYVQVLSSRGHRDDVIARELALGATRVLRRRAMVYGGVHLDQMSQEEQQTLLENAGRLVHELIAIWRQQD